VLGELCLGIATVSVAAIGVPPMAFGARTSNVNWFCRAFGLAGGTPASARETHAIPEKWRRSAETPLQGIQFVRVHPELIFGIQLHIGHRLELRFVEGRTLRFRCLRALVSPYLFHQQSTHTRSLRGKPKPFAKWP
jgi:hypothetical protein